MNNKIPCGGFEFDDSLEIRDGKLSAKPVLDALSGGLIVTLTKDETHIPFTSASRAYTADKTIDEINDAIDSGKNIILFAKYIDDKGNKLDGVYHLAGFYNGALGFINVKMVPEEIVAGTSPMLGYDAIILTNNGVWVGSYTNLRSSP